MKGRFALIFLLTFALLVPFWWLTNFGHIYEVAVIRIAALLSPLVNGWFLEPTPSAATAGVFRRGTEQMDMMLQLPALSMGLMPLLSLIAATPNQDARRLVTAMALGVVLYFGVDVAIVLTYPYILDHPNRLKDTLGVFSGLVGFVVAPLGIWFVLTFQALKPVWQLLDAQLENPPHGNPDRPAKRRGDRARS